MASGQCCKPAVQTCSPGEQRHSLGEKVSEMTGWAFKIEESGRGHTETESQTQAHFTKSQATCCNQGLTSGNKDGQRGANGLACKGRNKKKRENRKKGLLERIKDGISRHSDSSSSSSSSSSESDSDDEKHGKEKN